MKHTPGPWTIERFPDHWYQIKAEGFGLVASSVGAATKETAEANAKLIAKSPELFELVKELVKLHLKTCGRCADRGPDTEEPCPFLPDAVMLIKENEG